MRAKREEDVRVRRGERGGSEEGERVRVRRGEGREGWVEDPRT